MKSCFVISPIGEPDSPHREHADAVFDYIIKPAAERAGYAAVRADHEARPGLITDQMYDRILGDELVIVVLTFHNPNVFYELAIAEAAAKPLILLIERGHSIPFDIKDRRIIEYDLKPQSVKTDRYVDTLFRAITGLDTGGVDQKVPFRPQLAPLGGGESMWRMLPRSEEFAPKERLAMIRNAGSVLWYQGLALFSFAKIAECEDALREAIGRGVQLRVLLMHPDNPALAHLLHDFSSNYIDTVRGEIRAGAEFWMKLAGDGDRLTVKFQTKGAMFAAIQMNDAQLVWTPYSLMRGTSDSPGVVAARDAPLYELVREEFRWAWRVATNAADPPPRAE
jgi:hypothetical protein